MSASQRPWTFPSSGWRWVVGWVALSLGGVPANAQTIDDIVEGQFAAPGIGTGTAIGVHHEGAIAFLDTWGRASREATDSLSPETLFPFPAMTEVLLAATVRALDQQGSLDAGGPIGRWLPDLPEEMHPITLDQLLRHEAGLDDVAVPDSLTLDDVMDDLPGRAVFTEPGAVYSRSRYSYPLAARVLEAFFQLPLEEVIDRSLLTPLGMDRSTLDLAEARRLGVAAGYAPLSAPPASPIAPTEPLARAGGLPVFYSTVPDVLTFLTAWREGAIRGAGLATLPSQPRYPDISGEPRDGFSIARRGASRILEVRSQGQGFSALARIHPQTGTIIVAWANGSSGGAGGAPGSLVAFVEDRLFGAAGPSPPIVRSDDLPIGGRETGEPRPLLPWAGRYLNGAEQVVLREAETPGLGSELAFFDGQRELPVEWLDDQVLGARLPGDGRIVIRMQPFHDAAGRAYLFVPRRAFIRIE